MHQALVQSVKKLLLATSRIITAAYGQLNSVNAGGFRSILPLGLTKQSARASMSNSFKRGIRPTGRELDMLVLEYPKTFFNCLNLITQSGAQRYKKKF